MARMMAGYVLFAVTRHARDIPTFERAQRAQAAALLQEQFQTVPVDVTVRFRSTSVDPAVLSDLRPGDVLRLAHPASAPLDVTVEDTTFAHATAGAQGPRPAHVTVVDRTIPGPDGELAVRIYRPTSAAPDAKLPALVYAHGGGWVFGNLDSHD
eukprot:gene32543-33309_t